jgi:hypothetical protein
MTRERVEAWGALIGGVITFALFDGWPLYLLLAAVFGWWPW